MKLNFIPLSFPQDKEGLVAFLISEEWPFHVNVRLTKDKVLSMTEEGTFDGSNHLCFWILDESNTEVGFIRLFDLDDVDDGHPLFDLRIRSSHRGKGIGKIAVKWLTKYLFEKYPNLDRIAGTTRADNTSMRKIFKSSGYAKEGHFRKDWPAVDGKNYDTVKYGILREDWLSGKMTTVNWNDKI